MMKFNKEYHPSAYPRRGYNNYRSEDGRFFIRNAGSSRGHGYRWIITTTDGSTPFTGYRGSLNASYVDGADTIAEAKRLVEFIVDREAT